MLSEAKAKPPLNGAFVRIVLKQKTKLTLVCMQGAGGVQLFVSNKEVQRVEDVRQDTVVISDFFVPDRQHVSNTDS